MFSFIDRERLAMALTTLPLKSGLNSLNYAIAMMGAVILTRDSKKVCTCYSKARKYLEEAETEDPGPSTLSLHALQALILITWHEFKGQVFARAWMSLGRALRLARVLGLGHVDSDNSTSFESGGFRLPLPDTDDWAELEERRRTFWMAFILDTYANARTKSPMTLRYNEVCLPSDVPFKKGGHAPPFHYKISSQCVY